MAAIIHDSFRKVMYRPSGSISEINGRDQLNELIKSGEIEQKVVNNYNEHEDAIDAFFVESPESLLDYKKKEFMDQRVLERSTVQHSAHYIDVELEAEKAAQAQFMEAQKAAVANDAAKGSGKDSAGK